MTDCLPSKKSGRDNVFQVLKKFDAKTAVRNSEERQNAILERAAQRREVMFPYVQEFLIDGKEPRNIDAFQLNSTYRRIADPVSQLSAIELYNYVHFPVSIYLVLFDETKAATPSCPTSVILSQIDDQPEEKLTLVMPQGLYKVLEAVCFECDGRKAEEKPSNDAKRNERELDSAESVPVSRPFGIVVYNTSTRETLFWGVIYNPTRKMDGLKRALKSCIPSVNESSGCFGMMRKTSSKKESNQQVAVKKQEAAAGRKTDEAVQSATAKDDEKAVLPEKAAEVSTKTEEPLGADSGAAVEEKQPVLSDQDDEELVEYSPPSKDAEAIRKVLRQENASETYEEEPLIDGAEEPVAEAVEETVVQSPMSFKDVGLGRVRQSKTSDAQQKIIDDASIFFQGLVKPEKSPSKKTVEKLRVTEDVQQKLEANLRTKINATKKHPKSSPATKAKAQKKKAAAAAADDMPVAVEELVEMKTIGKVCGERAAGPSSREQQDDDQPDELCREAMKLWLERDAAADVSTPSSGITRKVFSPVRPVVAPLYFGMPKRVPTVRRHKPAAH